MIDVNDKDFFKELFKSMIIDADINKNFELFVLCSEYVENINFPFVFSNMSSYENNILPKVIKFLDDKFNIKPSEMSKYNFFTHAIQNDNINFFTHLFVNYELKCEYDYVYLFFRAIKLNSEKIYNYMMKNDFLINKIKIYLFSDTKLHYLKKNTKVLEYFHINNYLNVFEIIEQDEFNNIIKENSNNLLKIVFEHNSINEFVNDGSIISAIRSNNIYALKLIFEKFSDFIINFFNDKNIDEYKNYIQMQKNTNDYLEMLKFLCNFENILKYIRSYDFIMQEIIHNNIKIIKWIFEGLSIEPNIYFLRECIEFNNTEILSYLMNLINMNIREISELILFCSDKYSLDCLKIVYNENISDYMIGVSFYKISNYIISLTQDENWFVAMTQETLEWFSNTKYKKYFYMLDKQKVNIEIEYDHKNSIEIEKEYIFDEKKK